MISLLSLGLSLVMLRVAPERAMAVLAVARRWIEGHARTVALVIVAALAVSLLRDAIAGLTG